MTWMLLIPESVAQLCIRMEAAAGCRSLAKFVLHARSLKRSFRTMPAMKSFQLNMPNQVVFHTGIC